MLAAHRGLDDRLLQRPAVVVSGFRTELGEAEPAREFLSGVVPLAAPGDRPDRSQAASRKRRTNSPASGN